MRTYRLVVTLLVVVASLLVLVACDLEEELSDVQIEGTGNINERQLDITGFDRIEASHAFDVTANQGDAFSVKLSVDESADEYLDVRKDGETLVLTLDDDHSYSMDEDVTMIAEITLPSLRGVTLSGVSTAEVRGFEAGEPLDATLSGNSALDGSLDAGDMSLSLSGSSRVQLTGSGANVAIEASGASRVALGEFAMQDVEIDCSGSSRVTVSLDGTLTVNASGSSEVQYLGDVTLGEIDTSGSASVVPQ